MGRRLSAGRKRRVELTGRDYALLRFVAEQKFASRDQLARRFFPGQMGDVQSEVRTRPDRVCYRRILELRPFDHLETPRLAEAGAAF
jgi:hypothetical protein